MSASVVVESFSIVLDEDVLAACLACSEVCLFSLVRSPLSFHQQSIAASCFRDTLSTVRRRRSSRVSFDSSDHLFILMTFSCEKARSTFWAMAVVHCNSTRPNVLDSSLDDGELNNLRHTL